MSVWLREAVGWVLLGVGIAAFAVCYFVFLLPQRVVEAGILAFVGWTVFRGGMHLLKVSMAAKAAREIRKQPDAPKPASTMKLQVGGPAPGRPRESVVPGRRS